MLVCTKQSSARIQVVFGDLIVTHHESPVKGSGWGDGTHANYRHEKEKKPSSMTNLMQEQVKSIQDRTQACRLVEVRCGPSARS